MATSSSSTEEIAPPALAHTPTEKPFSTASPIFCSYATSSPSETSTSAGSRKAPPKGRCMPDIHDVACAATLVDFYHEPRVSVNPCVRRDRTRSCGDCPTDGTFRDGKTIEGQRGGD